VARPKATWCPEESALAEVKLLRSIYLTRGRRAYAQTALSSARVVLPRHVDQRAPAILVLWRTAEARGTLLSVVGALHRTTHQGERTCQYLFDPGNLLP
jgi:hypothetical protein